MHAYRLTMENQAIKERKKQSFVFFADSPCCSFSIFRCSSFLSLSSLSRIWFLLTALTRYTCIYYTIRIVYVTHYRKSRHAKMGNFGFRENRHIDLDFFHFFSILLCYVLCHFLCASHSCLCSRQLFLCRCIYMLRWMFVCKPNRCCASLLQFVQNLEFTFICLRIEKFVWQNWIFKVLKNTQSNGRTKYINGSDQ